MRLKKRISASPRELGLTAWLFMCPDLWENEAGDFVAIGKDVTEKLDDLPKDAVISKGERAVLIPRKLLISAKNNIPSE